MDRSMSDKEMLALTYGAIKVTPNAPKEIVKMLEDHLFGPPLPTIDLNYRGANTSRFDGRQTPPAG